MVLTKEQKGVAKGMAAGITITAVGIAAGILLLGPQCGGIGLAGRLAVGAAAMLAPALTLAFAIARLARHRFFSPQDIAGSALSGGSDTALLLQSLIQNTLEQAVLATLAYLAWCVLAPGVAVAALPAASMLFLAGRLLFFNGYARGARSRALGFAMTFYPTLALLLGSVFFAVVKAVRWLAAG